MEDATQALNLNPQYLKAYYRKAACLYELDRLVEAKNFIEESRKFGENNEMEIILGKIVKEYEMVGYLK